MPDLLTGHDAVLTDCDGVVYLGEQMIEGAAGALGCARDRGLRTVFVTNNAGRSATAVAEHLTDLGIAASADDVVTSGQAGAHVLSGLLQPGAPVLVVGSLALEECVREEGLRPAALDEVLSSGAAAGVLQGYDEDLVWARLNEATRAVRGGATWVAANTDATRPTDRGTMPGTGMMVRAVAVASGREPVIAGKPFAPMYDAARDRAGARRPLFVGDRLDTDIAGARAAGMTTALVLSGAHGKHQLAGADAEDLPDHVLWSLAGITEPVAEVVCTDGQASCGQVTLGIRDRCITPVGTAPTDRDAQLDALRCLVALRRAGVDADAATLLDALDEVP